MGCVLPHTKHDLFHVGQIEEGSTVTELARLPDAAYVAYVHW